VEQQAQRENEDVDNILRSNIGEDSTLGGSSLGHRRGDPIGDYNTGDLPSDEMSDLPSDDLNDGRMDSQL